MPKSRLLAFLIKELQEVVPPTVFFAVGFNLVDLTTNLILADYSVHFANFMVATASSRCGKVGPDRECIALLPPF